LGWSGLKNSIERILPFIEKFGNVKFDFIYVLLQKK
jgi:hypothetical protein